jgi:hypothetical protein
LITRDAVFDDPFAVPVSAADVVRETAFATILNGALVAPAGTVTIPGSVTTLPFPAVRLTVVPPAGAAAVRVTVPVTVEPPVVVFGEMEREASDGEAAGGGVIVSTALFESPARAAVIVADVVLFTVPAEIVKVTVDAPAGTTTVAATAAAPGWLLETETAAPPAGAGPFRVISPAAACPLVIDPGVTETPVSTAGFSVTPAACVSP